ncbi:MAG: phosphoribosylformylglycinamidine synthase subunit PurQ, partial [Oscillospiraceae bacterium]|nr:phosphoribosylformylglycinamidine synthase subunit PurQ [Oscillospiraceae bacterium]
APMHRPIMTTVNFPFRTTHSASTACLLTMDKFSTCLEKKYIDLTGKPTMDIRYNPNTSMGAIEGITSPDGRVLGKMGHSERKGANICKNVPGEKDQHIFENGVKYFL